MSNIHYFQRYSQKENWVTNNTMLLLSRLNYFYPRKFEMVINSTLDNNSSVNIGVQFSQQNRSNESVPDGMISQESFEIKIETKLFDNLSKDQLIKHVRSFSEDAGTKILLGLSKQKVDDAIVKEVNKNITNKCLKNLKFVAVSFSILIEAIRNEIEVHEKEMTEIIDDFANLCEEQDLIDLTEQTMLGLTVGLSLNENLEFDMYYELENRNHNRGFNYIGLYANKAICAIGKLSKIVYCTLHDGKIIQP